MIQHLLTAHLHFLKDVIVTTADQNAGFLNSQIFHQFEIFLTGSDPAGDLRELQVQFHTLFNGLSVLLAVDKELCLADDAVRSTKLGQEFVDLHNLIHGVGLNRLLAVTQRSIGDPNFLRHIHWHSSVVECHLGYSTVRIHVPHQIGFSHVLQGIFIGLLLQQICFIGDFQHSVSSFGLLYTIIL